MSEFSTHDRDSFYRMAIKPAFPNSMQFVIRRPAEFDEDRSFSNEGLDGMVEQIKTFVLARILAEWNRTGVAPRELIANLDLNFVAPSFEQLRDGIWPWWQLDDKGEHPLEGSHRASAEPEP